MADRDEMKPTASPAALLEMTRAGWMGQVIYVAAKLGIADLLASGPTNSEQLARSTEAHPRSLFRLMRALVTLGVCAQLEDGRFELTPLGAFLRKDVPGSVHAWTVYWGGSSWELWGHLVDSVKTGESARKLVTGFSDFGHLARDPELASIFNTTMTQLTRLVAAGVVSAYDFSGIDKIMDVGGGYGELLATILKANQKMRGVLFDMPHAIDGAKKLLAEAGVADRCEVVVGDFFESLPKGAGALILKTVIHDWDDERSVAILKNCRQAMSIDGKVLLVERLMPERIGTSAEDRSLAQADLNMLVAPGGAERTEAEYRALFSAANLQLRRIVPAVMQFNVLEAIAA